jgi:hypothetical protein
MYCGQLFRLVIAGLSLLLVLAAVEQRRQANQISGRHGGSVFGWIRLSLRQLAKEDTMTPFDKRSQSGFTQFQ